MTQTIWKKIKIGGKTKKQLLKELKKQKINISSYAQSMIDNPDFTLSEKEEEIKFIKTTPAEMGLAGYPTTDQIYAKAKELGYELCPAETALHLRLDYKDQPMDEYLIMAMEAINGSDGDPKLFRMNRHSGGKWLDYYDGSPGIGWRGGNRFVFVSRKSSEINSSELSQTLSPLSLDPSVEKAIEIVKSAGYVVYKLM